MPGTAHSVEECSEAIEIVEPCAGIVIPFADAREALKWKERLEHLERLAVLQSRLSDSVIELAAQEVAIERRRGDRLNTLLIEAMVPAKWYESPILWFGAGALTVLIVVVAVR